MKQKNLILVVLCLLFVSLMNTNFGFSQEVMYLGGKIDVHTYPESWIANRLVRGEGKYIGFPLANYSENEIVRACKLFIVSENGVESVIWEEVVTIPAWDFIEITISGCDNQVSSDVGNYQLLLLTEHSNNLNDVNINSILVPVVDGGSGAQNPHPIEIFDYGTFDAGCTDYYISFVYPNNTTTWIAGETYEIRWEGNVKDQISFVSLELHEGGSNPREINYNTENDGSYFYTVPSDINANTNYFISLYSNDGPFIDIDCEAFEIKEEYGTAIVQVTNMSVPSEFQKGEPVEMEAVFYNIGNANFVGEVFLALYDENMNYLTDLISDATMIAPGVSVTLTFTSEAVQSDVGHYFIVAKCFDSETNQHTNLVERSVQILGISVNGEDLSDPSGTVNIVYNFNDVVNTGSVESIPLRSFIVVENTVTSDVSIEELLNNNKDNKTSYDFSLDYSFVEGEYGVSYVAFYDWEAKKNKKTEIKNIGNLPWYCFWGLTASFNISEPEFILNDVSNYVTQEQPIANYNEFVFSLSIEKDIGVNIEDMLVQMRFYNTCSGEIVVEDMYYIESVDLWFLNKSFICDYAVCDYDYRFLLTYDATEFSYPNLGYSALNIEVYPYFDVLPMNETGILYDTQYLFYSQVYANNPEDAQVYLHLRNPDHTQTVVELNNSSNQTQYFYWISNFESAGYYQYYFEAIAENGQTFYSDTSFFFVGFDENCEYLETPGMVSRDFWCPGCSSNNPGNGVPSHIIIHDTEISDIYELRESDIDDGAEDIRYHYLIDFEGTIYEGLEGGPNKSAEHFNCMNGHTISIGFLGDLDLAAPTEQALSSFDLLLEYLCSEFQIDPNGVTDHIFYDFENNDWATNEDMPQISLHSIVGFYPEHACDISAVGNCPGSYFPVLEETIIPFVHYCPENSQHANIELGANINIVVSEENKSNYKDILFSTELLSLGDPVVVNLRAILCNNIDTLLVQQNTNISISEDENTFVDFENNLYLDDGLYVAVIQYQTSDTSMWVSLSSEIYENEIDVAVGNINIDELKNKEISKNYVLYPNPNITGTDINIDFKNQNTMRYLEIYNYLGQKLITKQITQKQNKFVVMFNPGIYLLKIFENKNSFTDRLIVY